MDYCNKGLSGEFRISPKEVSFPLTNVCNNYCIMCHACSKDYDKHTYHNKEPHFVSLEQYKKIVTPPQELFWKNLSELKRLFLQSCHSYLEQQKRY